MLIYNLN